MPDVTPRPSLPLLRSWPRRVRSAAVHAISLADLALARTLSRAADAFNPRLRLQEELERLLREISLLREGILIKNGRMEQIEPHRRLCYPPTERLATLELRATHGAKHAGQTTAPRTSRCSKGDLSRRYRPPSEAHLAVDLITVLTALGFWIP